MTIIGSVVTYNLHMEFIYIICKLYIILINFTLTVCKILPKVISGVLILPLRFVSVVGMIV